MLFTNARQMNKVMEVGNLVSLKGEGDEVREQRRDLRQKQVL
jgi:hypothetical protein